MAARVSDVSASAGNWEKLSIYKVPCCMRGGNEKQRAYTPQIVSIGPYHHGEDHLQSMEEHKRRALHHFLRRSNMQLEAFLKPEGQLVQDLIDSYDDLDSAWKTDTRRFCDMMIADGVFMLEVFRSGVIELNYAPNDRIFGRYRNQALLSIIKRDLLMIENQLPMALLCRLVAVVRNNSLMQRQGEEVVINRLISSFFFPSSTTGSSSNLGECKHVLDVCRKVLVPTGDNQNEGHPRSITRANDEAQNNEIILPASMLKVAGMLFSVSETRSLKGTSFRENSTRHLQLPRIIIDHDSETLFHNLLAFERPHSEAGNEVTSYLAFMSIIIKDEKDVRALTFPGIIIKTNNVKDQTVVELLLSLPKDITVDPESNLAMVTRDLIWFSRNRWNLFKVYIRLYRESNSLMKLMSFIIAYLGLLFTITSENNSKP